MKKRFTVCCIYFLVASVPFKAPAELGRDWIEGRGSECWLPFGNAVVLNGKIWAMGVNYSGYPMEEFRYSSDGGGWVLAGSQPTWPIRARYTSVAHDGKMWVLGGANGDVFFNDVWYSADGTSWTSATVAAAWSPRLGHTSVVHDGKIWVIGGCTSSHGTTRSDVWYSSNGTSWTLATAQAPWPSRWSHTSVVYNGRMWVIGGEHWDDANQTTRYLNDVWCSSDGTSWTQVTAHAPWTGRGDHTSAVFNGKIWVIGGFSPIVCVDVWCSSDGRNWTLASASAPFGMRADATSLVYNGRLLLIGGEYFVGYPAWSSADGASWIRVPGFAWFLRENAAVVAYDQRIWLLGGECYLRAMPDVWRSSDGANWTQLVNRAPWGGRYGHTALIHAGRMWVLGGTGGSSAPYYKNDVWYSTDGMRWTSATVNAPWSPRHAHASVAFNNVMWVLGGRDASGSRNDVWRSSDGTRWTSATTSAAWASRSGHAAVVLNSRMWLLGGVDDRGTAVTIFGDVWSSPDGVRWTRATASAPWAGREGFAAVVCDGKIWVMGGATWQPMRPNWQYWNDVWYSSDGVTWRQAASGAPWSPRKDFPVVVHNRRMWVLGGATQDETPLNDVWYSPIPASASAWKMYP